MVVRVQFTDVGRDKKTWESEIDDISHSSLLKQIRLHAVVMSRDVEFTLNESEDGGAVVVGGVRTIGHYKILATNQGESGDQTIVN